MNTSKNNFFVSGHMAYLEDKLAAALKKHQEAERAHEIYATHGTRLMVREAACDVSAIQSEMRAILRNLPETGSFVVSPEHISVINWPLAVDKDHEPKASEPVEQAEVAYTPHHVAFIRSLMADGSVYHACDFHKALTSQDWTLDLDGNEPWFTLGFGVALEKMIDAGNVECWLDEDGYNYRLTVKALSGGA